MTLVIGQICCEITSVFSRETNSIIIKQKPIIVVASTAGSDVQFEI